MTTPGATEAVTPELTPRQRAKLAYDTITAFGWLVSWRWPKQVPDDAWPIDIITKAIREAEANALRRAAALAKSLRRDDINASWNAALDEFIRSLLPKEAGK